MFMLTSLLISLEVDWTFSCNGLISLLGGNRSFSFTWPAAMYISWNKRTFLQEESVQLDSGFQSIGDFGFLELYSGFQISRFPIPLAKNIPNSGIGLVSQHGRRLIVLYNNMAAISMFCMTIKGCCFLVLLASCAVPSVCFLC